MVEEVREEQPERDPSEGVAFMGWGDDPWAGPHLGPPFGPIFDPEEAEHLFDIGRMVREELGKFLTVVLFAVATAAVTFILYQTVPWLIGHASALLSLVGAAFLVFGIALFGTAGLFLLRFRHRVVYGVMELSFGMVSLWEAAAAVTAQRDRWPLVVAAVYIVIRGGVNVEEGYRRYRVMKRLEELRNRRKVEGG